MTALRDEVSLRQLIEKHNGRPKVHITIVRKGSTPEGTPGRLSTDRGFDCDTLELQWHNNERGVSCILPAPGSTSETYKAWLWFSPTIQRMVVRLEDKYGRADCLLHNMNFAGEAVGEETQVHGCTGVGKGYGKLMNDQKNLQFAILNSVVTLEKLISHLTGYSEDITVTYSWEVPRV